MFWCVCLGVDFVLFVVVGLMFVVVFGVGGVMFY